MGKKLPNAIKKAKDNKNASIKERPKTAVPMTAKSIHERLNKKPMGAGSSNKPKKQEEENLMILDIGKKEKRNEADKKKRWHPEEIRDDYIEKLKTQSKTTFGDDLAAKMYSSDFKNHVKCVKIFKQVFEDDNLVEPFLEVLDIVIKWSYVKSNEISNISFLKELYFFFDELVDFLIEKDYQMMEAEGTILCLCLIEKIGMNNPVIKEKIKEVLMKIQSSSIFFPKKIMSILIKGLASKNAKTVAECLECIAAMVQTHQLEVINDKDVKIIAGQCESPDNGIRQSALVACEEIYKITEDQFWTLVGSKLSTKAMDIIKARLCAHLGVSLNSTPVEDKKDVAMKQDKSPMGGRNKMKASGLNRSLNKSLNNKFNSSITSNDGGRRIGGNRNQNRDTGLNQANSSLAKSQVDPHSQTSRRKDSSVNRKLDRISSSGRKQEALDSQLEKEINKIKEKNEVIPEILMVEDDTIMEQDENLDTIGKNIKQLKYGDLSGMVDALVIINELITKKMDEAGDSLIKNANFLIGSISKVLHDVFSKTSDKIPLKFGKYFISIVNKVCSIKEIMRSVEERNILILVEQLLLKLLIPGLDTLGERHEGQAMFRNLNNTILRILENCHPTQVFVVFLSLLKKYKGYNKVEKLPSIVVKCLLKVTRIMDQIIDKVNIERILLIVHEYLLTKPMSGSKSDDVGIRITKTIINELVKIKREEIWDFYGGVDAHSEHDVYIKKWIEIILNSLTGGDGSARPKTASDARSEEYTGGLSNEEHQTLKAMIEDTQCGNQFRADQAYKNIVDFSNDFPNLDLDAYLKANCSPQIYSTVLTGLMKAKKRKILTGKSAKNVFTPFKAPLSSGLKTPSKLTGLNATGGDKSNRLSTVEKMQEYEEKRANLRQKYGSKRNNESESKEEHDAHESDSASSNIKPEGDNKLGSSIAAMNSSITEKWRKLNSSKLKTPGTGLNNTVGGGFKVNALQDKSTLDKDSNDNEGEPDANRSVKTKMALQARLDEVKARLGQIKKTHDKK